MSLLFLALGCSSCRQEPPCKGCDTHETGKPDDTSGPGETAETGETGGDGLCDEPYGLDLFGPRPTNVVFVTIDSLRRDRLNAFGYTRNAVSPTLDRLIEEGFTFGEHYSCSSWTYPSFLCALTGRTQFDLGLWPFKGDNLAPPIPDSVTLFAEILASQGFHTMLAGGSGFLGLAANMDQGHAVGTSFFYDTGNPDHDYLDNDDVLAAALAHVNARPSSQPFFMHVHFQQVHAPYIASPSFLDAFGVKALAPCESPSLGRTYDLGTKEGTVALWRDFPSMTEGERAPCKEHLDLRYDAAILETDGYVASLLDGLDVRGLSESTLVVFFTDHGEEIWDHGNFDHGKSAFDEVTRSMAAFWFPPGVRASRVCDMTTHEDIVPTTLEILGLSSSAPFTGRVPDPGSPLQTVENLTVITQDRTRQSIFDGRYKLVVEWNCDAGEGGPWWFFDLETDPHELDNLYGRSGYEEAANRLRTPLEERVHWVDAEDPEMTFSCPWSW